MINNLRSPTEAPYRAFLKEISASRLRIISEVIELIRKEPQLTKECCAEQFDFGTVESRAAEGRSMTAW